MTTIVFKKAYLFNRHRRSVGMITRVTDKIAGKLITDGVAERYNGEFPPKGKMKFTLKDLK